MAELSVQLTADINNLNKGLKSAVSDLEILGRKADNVQAELTKLTSRSVRTENAIERLNKAFKEGKISQEAYSFRSQQLQNSLSDIGDSSKLAENKLSRLNKQARQLGGGGMPKLGKATANANPTLQEFSRVIQDAPFGIQGVGNNITQLASNFGNLQRSAGGTLGALKLLGSSFLGPGGLIFAISTVVSLLTVYGDSLFKTKTAAEKLAEATKKQAEALKEFEDALTGISRASLLGAKNATEELTKLRQLRTFIEDTTKATDDRLRGVKQLRREFPGYFRDVSDEEILNGNVKKSYEELTRAIVDRAKATAATELLVENQKKQLVLEQQLNDARRKGARAQIERDKASSQAVKLAIQQSGQEGKIAQLSQQASKAEAAITTQQEKQVKLLEDIKKLKQEAAEISIYADDNFEIERTDPSPDPKKKFTWYDIGFTPEALNHVPPELIASAAAGGEKLKNAVTEALTIEPADMPIPKSNPLSPYLKTIQELNEASSSLLNSSITDTFANFGASIGEALASGANVFQSIGQGLLGSMGQFLSNMGKLLIEYGTMAVAKGKLDMAIAAGGPVAIGAGIAAIAVGTLLSAAGAALGSAARGGFSGSGGSTGFNNAGGNTSFQGSAGGASSASGSFAGTVVFRINGQDLVGVLSRNLDANKRLGGSISLG